MLIVCCRVRLLNKFFSIFSLQSHMVQKQKQHFRKFTVDCLCTDVVQFKYTILSISRIISATDTLGFD